MPDDPDKPLIIDALTHVHPDPKAFDGRHDLSLEFLIENLEASPVDKAIVTAIAAKNDYGTPNDFVAECQRRHPDRIVGFASVHPRDDPNASATLARYVEQDGFRGLKLHPRHQLISPDDPLVIDVVRQASSLGVPVAICGSQWKHAPLADQDPLAIDVLAKAVPESNIVLCHAGGFRFWDAFIVAVANPNVFLETSIALTYFHETPFEDQFMFCLKELGASRIIYGSDHPEFPLKDCYEQSRAIFVKHGFGGEALTAIFGGNISGLLRL